MNRRSLSAFFEETMELWERNGEDSEDDDYIDDLEFDLFPSGRQIQEENPAVYEGIDYSEEQEQEEEEYYNRSQEEQEEYFNRSQEEQEEYYNRTEEAQDYRENLHRTQDFFNGPEEFYNEAEYENHYSMDNDDFPIDTLSIEHDDFPIDEHPMAESVDSTNESFDLINESFHSMSEYSDSMSSSSRSQSPSSRSNQSLEIIDLDSYQLTPQQIIDLTTEEAEISHVPNSQPFHHPSTNVPRTTYSNNAARITHSNNAQRIGYSPYSRIAQRTGSSAHSNNAQRNTHSNNVQRNSSASRFLFSPFMAIHNIPWNSLQASQLRNSTFPINESSSYEQLLRLQERIGEVKERGASAASIASQLPKFRYSTRFPSSSCATASQAKNFFSPRKPPTTTSSSSSKSVNSTPNASKQEKENCVICLEEFKPQNVCRETNCGHVFHSKCIENWLKRNANCPICRGEALKKVS